MSHLKKLLVVNFRCFLKKELLDFKKVTLFIGPNGCGKTSIIEAIYVLSKGKSFRAPNLHHLVADKFDEFAVFARTEKDNEALRLKFAAGKKKLFQGDQPIEQLEMAQLIPCILFSPDSLSAVKGPPLERRELLDDAVILQNPLASGLFREFHRCLDARNKTLFRAQKGQLESRKARAIIESMEPEFMKLSEQYREQRSYFLRSITPEFLKTMERVYGEPSQLSIKIKSCSWEDEFGSSDQRISMELKLGRSLYGPQKDEISFVKTEKDVRYDFSQGQLRGLILAFKMAQAESYFSSYGESPILLLDDVLSELDARTQKGFADFIAERKSQVFLTATGAEQAHSLIGDLDRVSVALG